MIDVLIVDDSTLARDLISNILESDSTINIIGRAKNGKEAIEFVNKQRPHVIAMDINMPVLDGTETTKIIMERHHVPTLILSTYWNKNDVLASFRALKAGAISIVEKPVGLNSPRFGEISDNLIRAIKSIANVKIMQRALRTGFDASNNLEEVSQSKNGVKIIGIGAPAGGMVIIEKILSSLKKGFSLPIVVVQHITPGFIEGFVDWLNQTSQIPVKIAEDREKLQKAICYLAPDFHHLALSSEGRICLFDDAPVSGIRPSITYLFESLAESYKQESVAILLSGIGNEGVAELNKLADAGAVTIAHDKDGSFIFEMPGIEQISTDKTFVYSSDEIINFLNGITNL